jgi:hypothetical protein
VLLNASLLNVLTIDEGGLGGGGGSHSGTPGSARFITDTDLARLLTSAGYNVAARVRIQDPSGVIWDYSNRDAINWIHSIEYSGTIDQNDSTATVKLWREVGGRSLAPFRTNSAYNQIAFVEADATLGKGPSIDAGRRITIDVATVDIGITPADSDYHTIFDGYIDRIDWANAIVELDCRDLAAELADTWFTKPNVIGGFPVFDLVGAVIELIFLLAPDTKLHFSVPAFPDPDVVVTPFKYDIESGLGPIVRVVGTIGWDVRMRWDDSLQAFSFTLRDPGRNKTVADWTFPPSSYYNFSQYRSDRTPIRNDVTVYYGPSGDPPGSSRASVNAVDLESVRRYGRRSMIDQEDSGGPIQDSVSAQALANLIVGDIADPFADAIVEMPFFWPADLHDLISFPANLVHSDEEQKLSIVAYHHQLDGGAQGKSRSQFTVRGKPAGSYYRWLARKPVGGETEPSGDNPVPGGFALFEQVPNYTTDHVAFNWGWGGDASATFDLYVQLGDTGFVYVDTIAALTFTYDYDVGTDIEPFHTPPDAPQVALSISFYLIAKVGSTIVATSRVSSASYGRGP